MANQAEKLSQELSRLFKALESLRKGEPVPGEPVYTHDGDHLSAMVVPSDKGKRQNAS
jgi:hypothetical protein